VETCSTTVWLCAVSRRALRIGVVVARYFISIISFTKGNDEPSLFTRLKVNSI
jgi:hypothetical protein